MWALSYHIKEDSFDSATVEDAELFDGVDFKNTWNLATLRNKRMMKLARSISGFGIGPIDDVLLGMIPPLSYRGILPTQVMMSVLLRKPKSHEEYHEWGQAQNAYITLLTLSMNPRQPSMDRISYEVVVELIEFLFLANEAVKDSSNSKTSQEETQGKSDRPAKVGNQAKALAEAVSTVTKELRNHPLLSSVVEELRWFYQKQRRQHRFDKLFPTPETVQSRASADCDETPRQTESLTDDEGTFIEDSEARRSSVWRDENEVGNSHKQRKPDPRLKQLTKFSKYHESCIYAQDDPQSDAKFDQFCDQSGWADKSDIFGWYPLHYATVGDDKNLFEKMFDAYVKRDIQLHELRDKSGRTPLHYAAMYKPDRIKHFTGSNAEKARLAVNARGRGKTLPVHCAARYGNKVAIEELGKYSSGAAVDAFGRSALHLGVIAGNLDAVRAFSKGDNATIQTGEELSRRTPLHFALMASDGKNAKNDVLKELMKREQDLKAIMIDDEYKETPIRLALRKEDDGFFEMLLRPFSKGPQRPLDGESKPSVVTSCFRQVFKDAISLEREQVLRLMFEHIIDVNHDWEPGWIEDAFAIAHRLLHVDMLNKMFKIVESMVAAAKVSSEYYDNLHKMFKNQESAVWIWAIQNGNLKFMEETLDKKTAGLHWNKKDSSNRSALAYIAKINRSFDLGAHRFSVQNRIRMFEILWHNWRSWTPRERERALNERQGSKSKTPLIYAVRNGFLELAQRFIAAGALSRGFDDHDMSAFTYALRETDEPWKELWKQMVDKDPEVVNECNRNYYSTTTLIEATRNGEREVVDFLSTCPNIDPNAQDTEGDTVLAWSYWQNASMTSTLMQKFPQLDPHLRNNKGSSPRMIAYTDAHYDELTPSVHDMFSGHGNRMREYEGTLMLSHAISRRNVDLVRFLLGAGADPCSTDDAGRSQIELTALRGNLELFKLLYDGGKVPEHQLKRVYHACIQRADTTSEQVLEELDRMKIALEPTDLDAHGWTVRDCAVYAENPQSLMKWPQLRHIQSEPSEKATRGESSSQHIPPSRWAVSADNPFFEVEGRLLSKSFVSVDRQEGMTLTCQYRDHFSLSGTFAFSGSAKVSIHVSSRPLHTSKSINILLGA
jgi:ankyrin repeat protein